MSALPDPPVLTANGIYDLTVLRGREYLLILDGNFSTAIITLRYLNSSGNPIAVTDGRFTTDGSDPTHLEMRFIAPTDAMHLLVESASATSTEVSLTPISK